MANIHFLRKLASDELMDTLYFATGKVPVKEKLASDWKLSAGKFKVSIVTNRNITVNGDKCKSTPEAKYTIQLLLD
tara:strand:- start:21 stop:248 length:228 start_codon:yes stop_codon:yes gene_type:complete